MAVGDPPPGYVNLSENYRPNNACSHCGHVFPTSHAWRSPFESRYLPAGRSENCPKCGANTDGPSVSIFLSGLRWASLRNISESYRDLRCACPELTDVRGYMEVNFDRVYGLGWLPVMNDLDNETPFEGNQPHGCYSAVRATFDAMVVGAWTAFESLTADLWEAAINSRPRLAWSWAGEKKTIEVAEILRALDDYGAEASKRIGTMLVRAVKVRFASTADRREAFERAFGEPAVKVLDHPDLRILERVRHVLVHRAGRADHVFVDECKKIEGSSFPQLVSLGEGQILALNGDDVALLCNRAIACGTELFRIVDERVAATRP